LITFYDLSGVKNNNLTTNW